jgi:hypothetical protein
MEYQKLVSWLSRLHHLVTKNILLKREKQKLLVTDNKQALVFFSLHFFRIVLILSTVENSLCRSCNKKVGVHGDKGFPSCSHIISIKLLAISIKVLDVSDLLRYFLNR